MNKLRNIVMILLICTPIIVHTAEGNQFSGLKSFAQKTALFTGVYQLLRLVQNRWLPSETDVVTRCFLAVNNAALSTIITFPQLSAKIKIPVCIVSALVTLAAVDHEVFKAKLYTLITRSHLKSSGKIVDINEDTCVICHATIKEALSTTPSRRSSKYDMFTFKPLCCQNGDHLICGPCFVNHFFHENKVDCPMCRQVCPDYEIMNPRKIDSKGLLLDWLVKNTTFKIVQEKQ